MAAIVSMDKASEMDLEKMVPKAHHIIQSLSLLSVVILLDLVGTDHVLLSGGLKTSCQLLLDPLHLLVFKPGLLGEWGFSMFIAESAAGHAGTSSMDCSDNSANLHGNLNGGCLVDAGRSHSLSIQVGQEVLTIRTAHHWDAISSCLTNVDRVLKVDIFEEEEEALQRVIVSGCSILSGPKMKQ